MTAYNNPFEYDAAKNLSDEMILDFFIEDHNYSRLIKSTRNIFIVGERGSGKSMNLLYHSLPIQSLKTQKQSGKTPLDYIGVYIPCNTPLFHKQDHKLFPDEYKGLLISENLLVLTIGYSIADTLSPVWPELDLTELAELKDDLEFILSKSMPSKSNFFEALKLFFQAESTSYQRKLNSNNTDDIAACSWTFSSLILPLITALKKVSALAKSHFMFLVDDGHDLNSYQRKIVNSWIAYRDHTMFSIKVATVKANKMDFTTSSGGTILDGHDFIIIDLEQPFQNKFSPFGKLAKDIIEKRLEKLGTQGISAFDFFPENAEFRKDLQLYEESAREKAIEKFPNGPQKSITNYIYKYARVQYFRDRSSKANRPPYSGFELLTHLSTGVVRNLLDPCYWMYDRVISELKMSSDNTTAIVREIPPKVQTEIIIERSEKMWERLRDGLDRYVQFCSSDQAKKIHHLFDALAVLFRKRLMHHKSEPRAIVFSISGLNEDYEKDILPMLDIARRANFLYVRTGPSKDDGKLEPYYVPNRLLWPSRGLDPQGQYARVSLKAFDIIAAMNGTPFPYNEEEIEENEQQRSLPL